MLNFGFFYFYPFTFERERSREEEVRSRVIEVLTLWPAFIMVFIHANYSVMNNECLFSYGEDVFLFLSKFCVWGSKFQANVIRSAQTLSLSFIYLFIFIFVPVESFIYKTCPKPYLVTCTRWGVNETTKQESSWEKKRKRKAKKP